ncbi:SURF1 family protein [Shewanella zhangzhouensis]|uniref:SURF1 family protein n=1 Tax=Shewanella zhangzhouensis TaxID=2864213 RepID=UPI001C65FB84|nr:SURF1 family protein [Shewanella zhangzhouensis]QYK05112.1 SURF1 family protein [Shewanella zhangzhouensis]
MDSPGTRPGYAGKLLMLFTLVLFAVLVKLGFWQLERAEEKRELLASLAEHHQASPLSMDSLLARQANSDDLEGYRLEVTGEFIPGITVLLDNQVLDGQVGYKAFRLLRVNGFQSVLLVELGFVAAGRDRATLPQIEPIDGQLSVKGRIYRRKLNPLSDDLAAEAGDPMRIQALNIPALAAQLQLEVIDLVLQPDSLPGRPLPRRWMPVNMPPEKHLGYAAQWFSLAAALALLVIFYVVKSRKKQNELRD